MKNLDQFKKEYISDGEKSYLSFIVDVTEEIKQYQVSMLENNKIEMLLPFHIQRVNDDLRFSYDITSKIALNRILERRHLSQAEFEHVISQFARLIPLLKDYLLDLASVVLDKSFIYCDPSSLSLFFMYFPLNMSHCEPERSRLFLKKLIVEDIRLQDDASGTLLKRLLEALKSETFTTEHLYQCIENYREKTHGISNPKAFSEKTDYTVYSGKMENRIKPTSETNIYKEGYTVSKNCKPDFSEGFESHEQVGCNKDSMHNTGITRAQKSCINEKKAVNEAFFNKQPGKTGENQNYKTNSGVFKSKGFFKYLRFPYLILAGINIGLLAVLILIIVSSRNTPGNTVSNILGFILIASACNYFLVTRLTSKQDKDTTVNKRRGQNMNAFENCQAEEDIILPGIPVINREATWPESVAGSKTPFIQEPGQAVSDTDMATNDETYMVNKVQKQVVQEQPAEKLKKPDETVGIYLSQVFSDRTVILGKPSDNIPYLLSNLNPSEKLLLNKKAILIGRLKDNVDYTINNRAVGKIHAEMINKGGKYYIIDLNSVNGTYVNGERLVCNTETLIKNGDKITFANEPFTFIAS